ncbi:MAG: SAM-dependent methyltransferase [Opitutaceae bacterium]
MSAPIDQRAKFIGLLRTAVAEGLLVKLTLGKHRGADVTLQNLLVRPVTLKNAPHLTFVWRHATRDITKNHRPDEALVLLEPLIGADFLDAHLFTDTQTAQLECQPGGTARLHLKKTTTSVGTPVAHDRIKSHVIPATSPWLRDLGVTNDRGQPREGMADKFRQIQKFTELLGHLLDETKLPDGRLLKVADMGSGKGYLTFAVSALLGDRAEVHGVESRPELVELCNRVARENGLGHLHFTAGEINSAEIGNPQSAIGNTLDVLIALHACDTATDDALAKGIAAGASLLVVSPCCQKELRAQLIAPAILADALRHGIFQERQAEFVTDALRAQLLEWAGYKTKVFEFISTEHTARNLMIAAIKVRPSGDPAAAQRLREFAAFYGIHHQSLATHLGLSLAA